MDSNAFYLKYRPQKLSELDLVEISQELLKIVKSSKIPHALLFAGPKGTGKTSAARILAKAVNCQKPKVSGEPCNRCEICSEITSGAALDLIEIDAASNRGIDDIRSLREKIKLAPARNKYKVYIIDEVHMLTTEAFNALLKTLEEPPRHAIFILCTTQPEKLPETIISRCMRFNFRKAKPEEIVKGPLKRAIKGEKIKVEKGVLEEIARSAEGSFRDAHKILEQLSFGGGEITLKETKKLLGGIEELAPEKLLGLLADKDTKGALKEIERVVSRGGELTVYLLKILECLRAAFLAKVGLEGQEQLEELKGLGGEEVGLLISLFTRAANELKITPIPQLPLELAAVEFCSRQMGGENRSKGGNPSTLPVATSNLQEIESKWPEILTQIKPLNHSVEALLKATRPLKIDGEFLTLEVFYKFHKERLETEKCRTIVEEVAGGILGRPLKLKCVLGQKPPTKKAAASKLQDSDILQVANDIFNGKIPS